MTKRRRLALYALLSVLVTGGLLLVLTLFSRGGPGGAVLRLGPDQRIVLESVGPVWFTEEGQWALMLTYVTEVPLQERGRLTEEARQVLDLYAKGEAERRGYGSVGMITTNQPRRWGIQRRATYNFVFIKGPDGVWRILPEHLALWPAGSPSPAP